MIQQTIEIKIIVFAGGKFTLIQFDNEPVDDGMIRQLGILLILFIFIILIEK